MVQMDFVPEGIKEKIESRGSETGAWRGEVPRDS